MLQRVRDNASVFQEILTRPAYSPIRQAMVRHIDARTICMLAQAVPSFIVDDDTPFLRKIITDLLDASIKPWLKRALRPPARLRQWAICTGRHTRGILLSSYCVIALENNCDVDVLEDFWHGLSPYDQDFVAEFIMTNSGFMAFTYWQRQRQCMFDNSLHFIWRHCCDNVAYKDYVTRENCELLVNKFISAGASHEHVDMLVKRIDDKFDFHLVEMNVMLLAHRFFRAITNIVSGLWLM